MNGGGSPFRASEPPVPASPRLALEQRHAGKWVLVVDDDPASLEYTAVLLEEAGLLVDRATCGASAVSLAGMFAYSAILVAIWMPVMDGSEATRLIRRIRGHEKTPILAMTADIFIEEKAPYLIVGINDLVIKPFTGETLFAMLLLWLGQ
jgi:CheY-like chemotaxis protein